MSFSSRDKVKWCSERYSVVMFLQEENHILIKWRLEGKNLPQTLIRIYIKLSGMHQIYK